MRMKVEIEAVEEIDKDTEAQFNKFSPLEQHKKLREVEANTLQQLRGDLFSIEAEISIKVSVVED